MEERRLLKRRNNELHFLAVGFLAAMTARGKRDLWALDILDYDGKEWLFTVSSKEEGEELLKYLDRYFMI